MSRTTLTTEVCHDFYFTNINVAYDVRTILFVVTNLLTPAYVILSLVAVASRCNNILKALASHGKTSTNEYAMISTDATERTTMRTKLSSSWSSWCWVSKRRFVHFYLVGLLSTAIATIYHLDYYNENIRYHPIDWEELGENIICRTTAVVLLVIHIIRRAYECLYVQQYRRESSKMHIAGYALGVGHYVVLPLVFWDIDATDSSVVAVNNINVKNENHYFGSRIIYSMTKMTTMVGFFILGMIGINLWLQYEQGRHHVILADIRRVTLIEKKQEDKIMNEDESNPLQNQHYSLPPYRRWFRYVLSPHYLAELLIYLSFAMILEISAGRSVQNNSVCENSSSNDFEYMSWFERMIIYLLVGKRYRHWTLFVWVSTNMTVSALNSYDWYNSTFKNSKNQNDIPTTDNAKHRLAENNVKRRALFPNIL